MKRHLENLNRPKILMIGPYPPPYGGIAVVVRDLMNSPLKDDFDLKLLKTVPKNKNIKNRYIEDFSRVFHDIYSILKEQIFFRPAVVHIHTSYDLGWPKHSIYVIISKIFGSRVILHIHAYHRPCKNKFPKTWLKRFIFPPKLVLKIVDYVFTLSDKYTENIITAGIKTPTITIPNGVHLKHFLNITNKDKKHKKITITYIGTIEKRKGIYELMAAADELIKRSLNLNLIIAGEGPARQALTSWYSSLKAENISYLGHISEEKKIEVLANTDIFVLQSTNEGFPIALLEAIAAGCAIITTPVGSIPDVIKHGINGLLISPEDKDNLIKAILRLYANKELLESIQDNNLKKRYNFSWESISEKISETYKKLGMRR